MKKHDIRAIQRARELAVQALYQWGMTQQPIEEIEAQFISVNRMEKINGAYFSQLIRGVLLHQEAIEAAFVPFLDRPLLSLNPIELSVIQIGAYELLFSLHVPYRVVLDESVKLAKTFGSQDGYRYVNAILNQLAKKVRQAEGE